jgi:hypothetical protein
MEIHMRLLNLAEIAHVAGGGGCYTPPPPCGCDDGGKHKNNNGYGNGPESGPPPGHSGEHNPQLIEDNRGPRGPR